MDTFLLFNSEVCDNKEEKERRHGSSTVKITNEGHGHNRSGGNDNNDDDDNLVVMAGSDPA